MGAVWLPASTVKLLVSVAVSPERLMTVTSKTPGDSVFGAMVALMKMQGAPSLPVHDSLIVPVSHEGWAMAHLHAGYRYHCKVLPYLEVHGPISSSASTLAVSAVS